MEKLEILLRYLTSWPVVVLILGVCFIIKFREAINNLIQRITKVYGVAIKAGIPPEQQTEKIEKSLPSEEEIKKSVKKKDLEKVLLKGFIKLSNEIKYERTFNMIYGSQIELLEYLSKKGTLGEKYINLRSFYNYSIKRWRSRFPTGTPPKIISYFGFLEKMGYIKYLGKGDKRIVKITPHGNDFISYMIDRYPAFDYKYIRNF